MAGEASTSARFFASEKGGEFYITANDMLDQDLPDLMENLLLPSLPPPDYSAERLSQTPFDPNYRSLLENSELEEYRVIMENLSRKILGDGEELKEKFSRSFHGKQADGNPAGRTLSNQDVLSMRLEDSDVANFMQRHVEQLPRGMLTPVELLKKVLSDMKENRNVLYLDRNNFASYPEIMDEIRMSIVECRDNLTKGDIMSMGLTDRVILEFYQKYFPEYSRTPLTILRRVISDLKSEFHVRAEEAEQNEKKREQTRKDFSQAYHRYHDMAKSGQTPAQAMEVLRLEEYRKREAQNPKSQAKTERPIPLRVSTPLTLMDLNASSDDEMKIEEATSDEEMKSEEQDSDEEMNNLTGRASIVTFVDREGHVENDFFVQNQQPELSIEEMEDFGSRNGTEKFHHFMGNTGNQLSACANCCEIVTGLPLLEEENKVRGQVRKSPSKRRKDSMDRNPSPTKKGKMSMTVVAGRMHRTQTI